MLDVSLMECPTCRMGTFLTCEQAGSQELVCDHCSDQFEIRTGIGCFLRRFDDYTENYDQICKDDLLEPKTPTEVKQIFTQLVQWRTKGVTCDLGVGDGYVITRVDSMSRFAVDIAFSYLDQLPKEISRIWSTVEEVPLQSGSVDTIICTDVLEHVLDARLLAVEIDRLLAADGHALIASPFEQDLGVYDLPEYQAKYGKYKYVHLRSIDDELIRDVFPEYEICFSYLITEGMKYMDLKPYPIKFYDLRRKRY